MVLCLVCLIGAGPTAANCSAVVVGARLECEGGALELRFELRGTTRWRLSRHGRQLWIDLDSARIKTPPRPLYGNETAPLASVRAFDIGAGRARLVLEVSERSDYAVARRPDELVVRLAPAGSVPDLAKPLAVRLVPPSAGAASLAPAARRECVGGAPATDCGRHPPLGPETGAHRPFGRVQVMIDPGHGGFDPGARSADGVLEKDCALQIARRLGTALRARGVSSALTRDGDDFLTLSRRTGLANRAGADLFISLHLNSSPNPAASGLEVFYLNNTTNRATVRLARMENGPAAGDSGVARPSLNYILSDMTQNYKANESVALARMMEQRAAAELEGSGTPVNALGVRPGPFYVLVGAHMPAVLVECGFLSNSNEAKRLDSAGYQARLAEGIATAVARYLEAGAAGGTL